MSLLPGLEKITRKMPASLQSQNHIFICQVIWFIFQSLTYWVLFEVGVCCLGTFPVPQPCNNSLGICLCTKDTLIFLSRALLLVLVQSPPLDSGDRIPKPRRISAELCEVFLLPALVGSFAKMKGSILQPGVLLCPVCTKCPQSSRAWSAWQ